MRRTILKLRRRCSRRAKIGGKKLWRVFFLAVLFMSCNFVGNADAQEGSARQISCKNRPTSAECKETIENPTKSLADAVKDFMSQVQMTAQTCMELFGNLTMSGLHCSLVFDGYTCWPPTRAGEIVELPCPQHQLSDPNLMAFRHCGPNGQWLSKKATQPNPIGWTNYTPCFSEEVQTLLNNLSGDDNSSAAFMDIASKTRIMEIVGYSISMTTLALSLIIFCKFKSLHNNRVKIHKCLFSSLMAQVLLRLILYFDQAFIRYIHKDYPKPAICTLTYIFLEYTISLSIMWMFLEGIQLSSMITGNMLRERDAPRSYFVIGFVGPKIQTFLWVYLTHRHYEKKGIDTCWYGYNFLPIYWILLGPRLVQLFINFLVLGHLMIVIITKLNHQNHNDVGNRNLYVIMRTIRAVLFLIPLLGVTNIWNMISPPLDNVGLFAFWSFGSHFLRSFEGLFVSVTYCFMNSEVQYTIKKCWDNWWLQRQLGRNSRNNFFSIFSSDENRRPSMPPEELELWTRNYHEQSRATYENDYAEMEPRHDYFGELEDISSFIRSHEEPGRVYRSRRSSRVRVPEDLKTKLELGEDFDEDDDYFEVELPPQLHAFDEERKKRADERWMAIHQQNQFNIHNVCNVRFDLSPQDENDELNGEPSTCHIYSDLEYVDANIEEGAISQEVAISQEEAAAHEAASQQATNAKTSCPKTDDDAISMLDDEVFYPRDIDAHYKLSN